MSEWEEAGGACAVALQLTPLQKQGEGKFWGVLKNARSGGLWQGKDQGAQQEPLMSTLTLTEDGAPPEKVRAIPSSSPGGKSSR